MASLRRHGWVILGATVGCLLAIALLLAPRPISGEGVLYRHLWCIGIRFDDGASYPVSFWPDGWQAEGSRGVVIDRAGQAVLREGERVAIQGKVVHDGGDTPCSFTEILTVEQVQRLSPAPAPSAGDSDG